MSTPYKCPRCCEELVETEDGNVLGYYGVLVSRSGVPMTGNAVKGALECPNCQAPLVPCQVDVRITGLTRRIG